MVGGISHGIGHSWCPAPPGTHPASNSVLSLTSRDGRTMKPLVEDERRRRRDGTSATHSDEVGRKVVRSQALRTAERPSRWFKRDAFGGTKPMTIGKRRDAVHRARQAIHRCCCSVEHGLLME